MQELDKHHSNGTSEISIGDFRCSHEIKHKALPTTIASGIKVEAG